MQIVFSRPRLALKWIFLALALGACLGVQAQQSWPNRPMRILVPQPPGGSTDLVGRLVAQKLSESLGQPVIVENRSGANGGVGAISYVNAGPNDHSFMLVIMAMMSLNQYLYRELGYDPDIDLKPVGLVAGTSNVVVVLPSLKVHTLKELTDYGRAHPNKFSYSSPGVGTTGHLQNELLKTDTGVDMLHVPYRGEGPAILALTAGDVQFMTHNVGSMLPHIRAGKMVPLAVTSAKRMPELPDVPTVSEAGFPNMMMNGWWAMVAHGKMPAEAITRMNRALVAVLQQPDFVARMRQLMLIPLPGTPEDMAATIRYERVRWKKAVATAGIKPD